MIVGVIESKIVFAAKVFIFKFVLDESVHTWICAYIFYEVFSVYTDSYTGVVN